MAITESANAPTKEGVGNPGREILRDDFSLTSPNCPRNWPSSWKACILFNIYFYNFLGNAFSAAISPMQFLIVADLGITLTQVSRLTTWSLLSLGFANFWGVAASRLIGLRYTILLSMLGFLLCNVWAPLCTSFTPLVWSRIVGGLCAGVVESLGPLMIAQLFHQDALARAMVGYTCALCGGSLLGPIFSGLISTGMGGWRWFFWFLCLANGINFITAVIMMPETSFIPSQLQNSSPDASVLSQKVDELDFQEKSPRTTHIESIQKHKLSPLVNPDWKAIWLKNSFFLKHPHVQHPQSWIKLLIDPILLMGSPIIFLSCLAFGMNIGWGVGAGIMISAYLGFPPNLWSSESIGLLNIGSFIGLVLGIFSGGFGADWFLTRGAKKQTLAPTRTESSTEADIYGEVLIEPRRRLIVAIIPAVLNPLGFLLIGYAVQHHTHWIAIPIGSAITSFGITGACNIFITFCMDSYPQYTGQLAITINVFKNTLGFGTAYATIAWYTSVGEFNMCATFSGMLWASYALMIPLYFYGKRLRHWSLTWMGH